MKTITISVQDADYELARAEAARRKKSVAELLGDLVATLRDAQPARAEEADLAKRQQWLARLRESRVSHGSQASGGPSTEEILDDLRSGSP